MKYLKIASFNIKNDNTKKIDYIYNIIKKENINLIGLQELTYYNTKKKYNYKLYGKYRFGNLLKKIPYNESNSIITNKKVIKNKNIMLPWFFMKIDDFKIAIKYHTLFPRIASILITSDNICIINTHLSSSRTPSIQKRQLNKINKLITKYDKYSTILMGDFNLTNSNKIFKYFKNNISLKYIDINSNTFYNRNGNGRTIDHIFVSKDFEIIDKGSIDMQQISDHNLIYTTLKF